MNLFALSGILAGFSSTVMAAFMFVRGRNRLHFLWGVFCISVAIWGFGGYQIATTADPEVADTWWRITHIGIILIPVLFTHFVYEFLQIKKLFLIVALYVIGLLFLVANFTDDLFIANMRWVFDQFYYDSPPGIIYIPFSVFFFGMVIYSHYKLWLAYKTVQGIKKMQIKYFLIGMAVSFAGGGLSFLPVYKIDIYPFLNILVFLYPIIIGYAMFKYRLMDIRVAARGIFIYAGLAVFAYAVFYLIAWIYQEFLGDVFSPQGLLAGLIIAPLFVLVLFGVNRGLRGLADRHLFSSLSNYQNTLRQLTRELNYHVDLDDLVNLIVSTTQRTLGTPRAGVLLANIDNDHIKFDIAQVTGFDEQNGISLVRDNFLTQHLRNTQKPLVRDELHLLIRDSRTRQEKEGFENLLNQMIKIEAFLCLPLINGGRLIGIIVLGEKTSSDAYTKEELELLDTMAQQAATAIENAQLYSQIQELNQDLEQKVEKQTKELQEKNRDLEKLLKIRSEFLDIAAHQLRTPVSVILGNISILQEEDLQDLSEEQKKKLFRGIYKKSRKLEAVIRNILTAFEVDSEEFSLEEDMLEPIDLVRLVEKELEEVRKTFDLQKVAVHFYRPSELFPPVASNRYYLEQVILCLLDNALNFTPEGKVEIFLERKEEFIKLTIKDSGIGIPESDHDRLFHKFSRGEKAVNTYPHGSGLGLFIVKKVVEAHPGGQITIESTSQNGSTFSVTLPIYKQPDPPPDRIQPEE